MLVKLIALAVLACIALFLLYMLGMAIYSHWLSENARNTRRLNKEYNRLETLIRKTNNER